MSIFCQIAAVVFTGLGGGEGGTEVVGVGTDPLPLGSEETSDVDAIQIRGGSVPMTRAEFSFCRDLC